MKKNFLILFLLVFWIKTACAQEVRYKVEYSVRTFTGGIYDVGNFNVSLVTASGVRATVFSDINALNSVYTNEKVITLPNKATETRTSATFSNFTGPGSCDGTRITTLPFDNTQCTISQLPRPNACLSFSVEYFRIYELQDFPTINGGNLDTNLKACEATNLVINNSTCNNQVSYALEYRLGNTWAELTQFNSTNITAVEVQPSDFPGYIIGDPIDFRLRYTESSTNNPSYSEILNRQFILCSPEYQSNSTTDATCNGSTDGSVTLTFDKNVDVAGGYEMRYFIYEGDPATFPESRLEDTTQPVLTGIQVVDDPRITLNSSFEGAYSGLGVGNYFIVYQEINYATNPVTVKSGEITPQFSINEPTPIIITNTSTSQPQCFGDTGSVTITASGGGFTALPNPSLEYGIQIGSGIITWQNSNIFSSLGANTYTVYAATDRDNCNTSQTAVINNAPSAMIISNNQTGTTSSNIATDGVFTFDYTGGIGTYNFLIEQNGLAFPSAVINESPAGTIQVTNLPIGTYQVISTYNNGNCPITPIDFSISKELIPTIGIFTIPAINCTDDLRILNIPVSHPTATNLEYRLLNGTTIVNSGTTSSGTITLNNLSPNTYTLEVITSRGNFGNTETVATQSINLTNVAPVSFTAVAISNSCIGVSDGAINITPSGGTNYEYSLGSNIWTSLTANSITGLSSGFYDVAIRNENNCTAPTQTNILVRDPDAILVTNTSNNATTVGGNQGTITLGITGGAPNALAPDYNVTWTLDGNPYNPNPSTINLANLFAGVYQATVTDANGCSPSIAILPITITEPTPLNITGNTPTPVSCFNGNDGAILIQVQGGIGNLTYTWINLDDVNWSTTQTNVLTGLSEGRYQLTLSDQGSPTINYPAISITQPTPIQITPTSTPVSCINGNNGTITVNTTGGTGVYEYQIDDGFNSFQASNTFTGLPSRTYLITVRDANQCIQTANILVGTPTEITIPLANITVGNVTTNSGSDGSITVNPIGGSGIYNSFLWQGPNTNTTTTINTITGLQQGFYNVIVTDSNGCIQGIATTVEVTEPGPLSISNIIANNVSCNGVNDGSITTTVTGTGTITYAWREVGNATPISTIGASIENLPPGNYTLTVGDDTANPEVTSSEIIIDEPTPLTAQAFVTEPDCNGGTNGSILITANGGILGTGYRYSIDGGAYQVSNTFSNLVAGSYMIGIQDGNLCPLLLSATILEPNALGYTIDLQQPLSAANADDGAISITAFGGTGNVTYAWSGPVGTYDPTSPSISNLSGGNYTLTITDANNCVYVSPQPIVIAEPGELIVNVVETVALECSGDSFGEITATIQGGVTPYAIEWFQVVNGNNNLLSENTEIIGNLSAGEYFVRVTDFNGISRNSTLINIIAPEALNLSIDSTTDILCFGATTGAISLSATGGTAPYRFFSNNIETTPIITLLLAGSYLIEVVDVNGCTTEETVIINAPNNPVTISNPIITDASEYLLSDGEISIDINGGTSPLTIVWTRTLDAAVIGDTNIISNLSAGFYEVLINDANGCSITESYEVSQPDIVEETIIAPRCNGESNGSISLVVNKGNGTYSYSWSNGSTTSFLNNLAAGTYEVTITGLPNGPVNRSYTLEDPIPLIVDLGENRVLCVGQELMLDATIEDNTVTYTWISDTGFSSSNSSVTITEAGNYTLTIQSASGCTTTGNIEVSVSTEEINAEFAVSSQVFVNETSVAVDISFPLPDSLEWILPENASISKKDNDEVEFIFSEAGEYEIGIITKKGECYANQTKKIIVLENDVTVIKDSQADSSKHIEDFVIFPNPTNGAFTVDVNISERGSISVKVFSFANNQLIASEKGRGNVSYSIPFDLSGMPSGVYAVLLETPFGSYLQKIIVK